MPTKPTLHVPQARLRPAGAADLHQLCALLWHEAVRVYLCDDTILPRDIVEGMLARSDRLDSEQLGLWMIETDRTCVGCAGLQPVGEAAAIDKTIAGGVEPLIALRPEARRQGIATAAIEALASHAKQACGLETLVAAVDVPNEDSHRLMRACAFKEIGQGPGPKHTLVFYERYLDARP